MLCKRFEGNIPRGGIAGSSVCSVSADIVKAFSKAVLVYTPTDSVEPFACPGTSIRGPRAVLVPQLHELENYYCPFSRRINQDGCHVS